MPHHRLLQRQLKKLKLDPAAPPDATSWQTLLGLVSDAYREGDLDRDLLERSLAISSEEMRDLYDNLRQASESQLAQERNRLRESEARYRSVVENVEEVIFQSSERGTWTFLNSAWADMTGYDVGESLGKPLFSFVHPDDRAVVARHGRSLLAGKVDSLRLEVRFLTRGGDLRWVEVFATQAPSATGRSTSAIGTLTDTTERKQTQEALKAQRAFYENILNAIPIDIAVFDPEFRYRFCNPAAIGDDAVRAWVIGKDNEEYCRYRGLDAGIAERRFERLQTAVTQRATTSWEESFETPGKAVKHHLRHLSPVFSDDERLEMIIGYGLDITERKVAQRALEQAHEELEKRVERRTLDLQQLNEQLKHDAFHDALTQMPNRALFTDRLDHAIERENRNPSNRFAVLFLDLDRFKVINDSLGHNAGDALLQAFGTQLQRCLRPADTAARLGGDEFTVLLEDIDTIDDAIRVSERIQQALLQPLLVNGHPIHLTVSVGIVSSETGYHSADEVLRDADIAMYRAKAQGKARHVVFEASMRVRAMAVMAIERDLREAIDSGQLEVQYQPIVSTESRQVAGFEALVRWQHPLHGSVLPGEFIPLAEETGLVIDLDRWVLRTACRRMVAWQRKFPRRPPLTLSVNLSGQQFQRDDLIEVVTTTLAETGFDAAQLKIEITERLLVDSSAQVHAVLNGLRALGVQLHIDDFGTGYSSLAYLQRFSADALKIDRSFVTKMSANSESAELVNLIVSMAHAMGMQVIAEGVETDEQFAQLEALACETMQGFLFSRPLNPGEAEHLLTRNLTATRVG